MDHDENSYDQIAPNTEHEYREAEEKGTYEEYLTLLRSLNLRQREFFSHVVH